MLHPLQCFYQIKNGTSGYTSPPQSSRHFALPKTAGTVLSIYQRGGYKVEEFQFPSHRRGTPVSFETNPFYCDGDTFPTKIISTHYLE